MDSEYEVVFMTKSKSTGDLDLTHDLTNFNPNNSSTQTLPKMQPHSTLNLDFLNEIDSDCGYVPNIGPTNVPTNVLLQNDTSSKYNNTLSEDNIELKLKTDFNISDLHDLLKCDMCKNILNEPVTLLCNHTFCQYCLQKLVRPPIVEQTYNNYYNYINNYININQISKGKCPTCSLSIWIPPSKNVNYIIRDIIIALYGVNEYTKIKQSRDEKLLKFDLKDKISDQLKQELWRSISECLNYDYEGMLLMQKNKDGPYYYKKPEHKLPTIEETDLSEICPLRVEKPDSQNIISSKNLILLAGVSIGILCSTFFKKF